MSTVKEATGYLQEVARVLQAIDEREVQRMAERFRQVREMQGTIWTLGNGGSAATAMHVTNDLWKACGIKSIAMPGMVSVVTAYGNDEGWENMYSNAMDGMIGQGDALLAISCSGASVNVTYAMNRMDAEDRIVLTGRAGWRNVLEKFDCYAKICVPSDEIRIVEDVHLAICHCIVGMLMEKH